MENEAAQRQAERVTRKFGLTTATPITFSPEQMKVKSDMMEHGGADAEEH